MNGKKTIIITIFSVLLLLLVAQTSLACEFTFNYESIEAPLATVGDIGIRVYKTHNNCTLQSMNDYHFESDKLQILEESEWQEIERNVYEKWFKVMLSEKGEGYILIWKECSKEGYEEKSLPIKITGNSEEVKQALAGVYPYEDDINISMESGNIKYIDNNFVINNVKLVLSEYNLPENILATIVNYQKPVYVFYDSNQGNELILIVGEDIYYKFN